eukprot:TRINITY_DN7662_c0_g2_i2.p1 TRINITY_DN7662_c0_g2~~TRINITY_DN7662_c0_g2_i2.p1  ORF type:complete len:550 (+),score=127.49 TRINITY_DN7662_c0_g2_i2:36-1685(+)
MADWGSFGLDSRLLKAISKLKWSKPTLIQQHAVKQILAGKDVLARARTGSGKTGAYCLPLIDGILKREAAAGTFGLVLVPTKELAHQVVQNIKEIASCCREDLTIGLLAGDLSRKALKALLQSKPVIYVGTPTRVLEFIQKQPNDIRQHLRMLIMDEADLLFSYGYRDDVTSLCALLPRVRQTVLMSATLSDDVSELKQLTLRNPVVLKLDESDLPDQAQLKQYSLFCNNDNRYLYIYTMLKLKLVRGKTIIFVNSINNCYKLKLFLENFSIKSCVLNSELPLNSRRHIVAQFNKGVYDYIIASDEAIAATSMPEESAEQPAKKAKEDQPQTAGTTAPAGDYGVARGVDFKGVRNVINFDFPLTAASYVHRVGRTARGHRAGLALSFYNVKEKPVLEEVEKLLQGGNEDDEEAAVAVEDQAPVIVPYAMKRELAERLRYRCEDALKAVTKHAIRKARKLELETEIINSQKLKAHFEDNPRDLEILRHDRNLQSSKEINPSLKHIPSYLLPTAKKPKRVKVKEALPSRSRPRKPTSKAQRKRNDPLRTFK